MISLRKGLAAAACSLLAAPSVNAENPHEVGDWDIKAAVLLYTEPDRVTAVEPVVVARKIVDTDEYYQVKLTFDTLTGASGTGAVPSLAPQTFTRPSGSGSYTTEQGSTPLDDTFKDTRVALSLAWGRPAFKGTKGTFGFNVSNEYDYLSLGASALLSGTINDSNTTLSGGLSFANDIISPVGGKPLSFAAMQPRMEDQPRAGSDDTKNVIDAMAGFTQIIDANSLFQFNYSLSASNGYHTDPYKVISVVDPTSGAPVFDNVQNGSLPTVLFESRPDSRLKHSLFGMYKRNIEGDVIEASYRFMLDDWGITSHTVDLKYRWKLSKQQFLQPRLRVYQQGAADFYTPFFVDGEVPQVGDDLHASADYRLGEFNAYTLGLEYGRSYSDRSWSVALEYYLQTADEPEGKFGELEQLELSPDVQAPMIRFLYDF